MSTSSVITGIPGLRESIRAINDDIHTSMDVDSFVSYYPESITVDRRLLQLYAESHLGDTLNAEYCARRIHDEPTRSAVVDALVDAKLVDGIVTAVTNGQRQIRRGQTDVTQMEILDALSSAGLTGAVFQVMLEFYTHWFKKYGIVAQESGVTDITFHDRLSPTREDLVVDVLTREVEAHALNDGLVLNTSDGERIGVNVIKMRIRESGTALASKLRRIGENLDNVNDMLVLIGAYLVQDLPLYKTLWQSKSLPLSLVNHEKVVKLASNVTWANMALKHIRENKGVLLQRSEEGLKADIDQITSLFNDSNRYIQMSLDDFAAAWSKETIVRLDKTPGVAVLAYNMRGKPDLQVVDLGKTARPDVYFVTSYKPAYNAMQAAYGTLLDVLSSDRVRRLAVDVLEMIVENPVHNDYGVYCTASLDVSDMEDCYTALAMARARRVYIATNKDDEVRFSYEVDCTPYVGEPVSGYRVFNEANLFDPAEVLIWTSDWEGRVTLTDRVQVLPDQLEAKYVSGISKNKHTTRVHSSRSYGLQVSGTTHTVELRVPFVFNINYADHMSVIRPWLNSKVATEALRVVKELVEAADSVQDPAAVMNLRKKVFTYLSELPRALPPEVTAKVRRTFQNSIAGKVDQSARYSTETQLLRDFYVRSMDIAAVDFVLMALGLIDPRQDAKDGIFAFAHDATFQNTMPLMY